MFDATYKVLENLSTERNYHQRGDADFALNSLMSFNFIFTLHLMNKNIMGIIKVLSQVLQQKSQDILNAIDLVSSTTKLVAKMRDFGWEDLLKKLKLFFEHKIDFLDLNAQYVGRRGQSQRQQDDIEVEHYY